MPVIVGLITSPIAGFVLGYLFLAAVLHVFREHPPLPRQQNFRTAQVFSGGFVSFSHGANDAQKTMAIITLALIATHHVIAKARTFPSPPLWVVVIAATRNRTGHLCRRLADHPHPGEPDRPARARRRVRRADHGSGGHPGAPPSWPSR